MCFIFLFVLVFLLDGGLEIQSTDTTVLKQLST